MLPYSRDVSGIRSSTNWENSTHLPVEIALEMYRAFPSSALWVVPSQGHSPIWEMFGGSWEAAAIFPAVVQEFFDPSQPN